MSHESLSSRVVVVSETILNAASIAELVQQSMNYDRLVAYITRRRYPH